MVPHVTDLHPADADTGGRSPGREQSRREELLHYTEDCRKAAKQADSSLNDMEAPVPLTMYTTTWCGFCKNLKRQLGKAGVEIDEVDIERDPEAAKFVESVNGGNQTVPTLLFPDGSTMCNPSAAQVQKKLAELSATQTS
jgi:mycoredoxin